MHQIDLEAGKTRIDDNGIGRAASAKLNENRSSHQSFTNSANIINILAIDKFVMKGAQSVPLSRTRRQDFTELIESMH